MTLDNAMAHLERMERNRAKNEPCNKKAYQDARNLSAWVSIAQYGNEQAAKRAVKIIKSI